MRDPARAAVVRDPATRRLDAVGGIPSPAHLLAVCAVAALPIIGSIPVNQRATEATARMETLSRKLSHAQTIAPETSRALRALIQRSEYDCHQVACGAPLGRRNTLARAKLMALLDHAAQAREDAAVPRSLGLAARAKRFGLSGPR